MPRRTKEELDALRERIDRHEQEAEESRKDAAERLERVDESVRALRRIAQKYA